MKLPDLLKSGKIWTISNLLSLSRLGIAIFLFYFILAQNTFVAILLALLAVITDYADGYVARLRNETSELGKILDPVADKVAVALGAIALHQAYGLPLWVVLVIISRDILILAGSLVLIGRLEKVTPSEFPGKVAVTVISLLLLSYLLEAHFLKPVLLIGTLIAILVSFAAYLLKFLKILRFPEKTEV